MEFIIIIQSLKWSLNQVFFNKENSRTKFAYILESNNTVIDKDIYTSGESDRFNKSLINLKERLYKTGNVLKVEKIDDG